MGPELPGAFHSLAPVLDHYGYLAVAGFVLLEDFGVPVPGETILIAGAVYAGAGRLNVVLLAAVAFAAAVIGDNVGFAIGRFGGRRLVLRWGRYVLVTPARLDRAEDFFRRHGGKVVTIARFVEGLRQVNGIVAGIAQMPWRRRFLPFNALGALLWVGVWTAVGVSAGSHLDTLYRKFGQYERYILVVVAVVIVALIGRAVVHHWRQRSTDRQPESQTEDHAPADSG